MRTLETLGAVDWNEGEAGRADDETDPVLLHGLGQLGAGLERNEEAQVMTEGLPAEEYSGGLGYIE